MRHFDYALYDAFSDTVLGGSRAAVVADAAALSDAEMQAIAIEFSAPATCFVLNASESAIEVRFFSTQTEYPMCGHGSLCLVTWLAERGIISADKHNKILLSTPASFAQVEIEPDQTGRLIISLDLSIAVFDAWQTSPSELLDALGLTGQDLADGLPLASTDTDFRHLIVPVLQLEKMSRLKPDLGRIETWCRANNIDTVMCYCRETVDKAATVHCREFCPAVGTPEAPATGTTNRALACYLHQFEGLAFNPDGDTRLIAEQGIELNRPGRIYTRVTCSKGVIQRIRVGGIATKSMQGILYL